MIRVEGERFVDEHGRTLLLRGANVGGNSKLPLTGDSFVGRPFPLADADAHFARLAAWGLTTIRFVTTWEAIEHAGPRQYDTAYLDHLEAVVAKAARHGLHVFIDFHQDVWSRFTGGDGAPRWTLEAAGFDVDALHETGAAFLSSEHPGPPPKMIWPTNAGKLGAATMLTLFFGGDAFAPKVRIDGVPAQRFLQEHFFGSVEQVVRRVAPMPHVFGVDLFNEPAPGYIGWKDLKKPKAVVEVGVLPSPLQSMALGAGATLDVKRYHRGLLGARVVGTERVNPNGRRAWTGPCVWQEHGVWAEGPKLLRPDHFRGDFGAHLGAFVAEGTKRVRALAPRLLVMAHAEPMHPVWSGPRPDAWSAHWYDGYVLFLKDFRSWLAADAFTQRPVFGSGRIRKSFAAQLTRLRVPGLPLLVGELGVAFDLRDPGRASAAMNRTMTAVEDAGVSATLWNYCADHTPERGDGWNGEDLSIFSQSSSEPDHGRAVHMVARPRPVAVAGTLVSHHFDPSTRRFTMTVRPDPNLRAPTTFFVPTLHYPDGGTVAVTAGRVHSNREWSHFGTDEQTLTLAPTPPARAP